MLWVSNNQNIHKHGCAAFLFTKISVLPSVPSERCQCLSQTFPNHCHQRCNQHRHFATASPGTLGVLRNCPCVHFQHVWILNNVPQPNSSWRRVGVTGWRGARSHGERRRKEEERRETESGWGKKEKSKHKWKLKKKNHHKVKAVVNYE